jgi:hypothetical protein
VKKKCVSLGLNLTVWVNVLVIEKCALRAGTKCDSMGVGFS